MDLEFITLILKSWKIMSYEIFMHFLTANPKYDLTNKMSEWHIRNAGEQGT